MKVILKCYITPHASKTCINGWQEDALKIRLAAVPEKGAANQQLVEFVAKTLGVPKSHVVLAKGTTSRYKTIIIEGLSVDDIYRTFGNP